MIPPAEKPGPAPSGGLLLRFALGVVLLGLLWLMVDVQVLGRFWSGIRPLPLAGAGLCLVLSTVLAGVAWYFSFPPHPLAPRPGEAVRRTFVAFAINNLVPTGMAGDVYLVWALARRRMPVAVAGASVVMVHACSLVVLLLSLILAGASLGGPLSACLLAVLPHPGRAVVGVGLAAVAALVLWRVLRALRPSLPQRLQGTLQATGDGLREVWGQLRALARQPLRLGTTLALCALALGLEAASFWLTAVSLGSDADPFFFMAMAPVTRVLHRVPFTVNAIGTQEVAAAVLWGGVGLPLELSLSVCILLHASRLGVAMLGGLLYLAAPDTGLIPFNGQLPVSE